MWPSQGEKEADDAHSEAQRGHHEYRQVNVGTVGRVEAPEHGYRLLRMRMMPVTTNAQANCTK